MAHFLHKFTGMGMRILEILGITIGVIYELLSYILRSLFKLALKPFMKVTSPHEESSLTLGKGSALQK